MFVTVVIVTWLSYMGIVFSRGVRLLRWESRFLDNLDFDDPLFDQKITVLDDEPLIKMMLMIWKPLRSWFDWTVIDWEEGT